jgi:putative membrane protein
MFWMQDNATNAAGAATQATTGGAWDFNALGWNVISAGVFGLMGIVLFMIALWLITKLAPFSVHKEIEEDQNVALGIVMGSILLGLAVILATAIAG